MAVATTSTPIQVRLIPRLHKESYNEAYMNQVQFEQT